MQRIKETWENFHYTIEQIHSTKVVFWGYFSYVVIGWIFLCLPFSQQGTGSTPLDNLFVSTSAVSTTGLSSIDISTCYSFFGQLVVLGLIQLGGIGYMTLGSFIILSRKSPLPSKRHEISKTVFSLPDSFRV
jgi:trk system potassium uptake protein TrkH